LVVHKTTNPATTVYVQRNRIFGNGETTKDPENRQSAGGMVINTYGADVHGTTTFKDNIVTVDVEGDYPFRCFGTCTLTPWSNGNKACYDGISGQLDNPAFDSTDCEKEFTENSDIRGKYPKSLMPVTPQFTPWVEAIDPYDCDYTKNFIEGGPRAKRVRLTDRSGRPKYGETNSTEEAIKYCKNECDNKAVC